MRARNWKAVRPLDLRDAFQWDVRFAKEQYNRSIDNVADLMGHKKWTVYKWIDEADMPTKYIKSFEHACGIDYVSRWLVESNGKIIIDVPRGKKCGPVDVQVLQVASHQMVGEVMRFYSELSDVDAALAAIQTSLEHTSWHRGNIEKYRQPELPFDEE